MTTSLAIADGVGMPHASVIKLIRKYVNELQEFGSLGFEIQVMRKDGRGGEAAEIAYLNEQQSTLLLTFMRNSEIVVRFKVALVKAFFEMRDHCRLIPSRDTPLTLSHRADEVVASDRVFRGFLRSARAAGLPLPMALKCANEQTILRTGMNMLSEIRVSVENLPESPAEGQGNPLFLALSRWAQTSQPDHDYKLADILHEALGESTKKSFAEHAARAGKILRFLGFSSRRRRMDGIQGIVWRKYWEDVDASTR